MSENPEILKLKEKIEKEGKLEDKFALAELYKSNEMMEEAL